MPTLCEACREGPVGAVVRGPYSCSPLAGADLDETKVLRARNRPVRHPILTKCSPALGENGVIEVGEGLYIFPTLFRNCS